MSERSLPWVAVAPHSSSPFEFGATAWVVADGERRLVCICRGEDDGESEAKLIVYAMNRTGDPVCGHCHKPATCFGAYEDQTCPDYACDDCCGHGCEDGHCEQLGDAGPRS